MMRRAVEALARRLTNRGLQKGIGLEAATCGHQRGHARTSTTYYHEQELPIQRRKPAFRKEEKFSGLASSSGRPGWWRSMFIQTQPTPNPASLMFLPGKPVMKEGSREFKSAREAMVSPLAKKLFTIDGVQAVFFGSDFVTITKTDDAVWQVMKPDVYAAIMDFYSSNQDLFTDAEVLAQSDTAIHEDDDEVVAMVKELLDTRIRPAVQEDGGDIMFRGFDHDTGVVRLKMQGACSGCPSSSATLKHGIENMLMHYIPEVKEVVEDFDEEQQESLKQFESLERSLESHLSH